MTGVIANWRRKPAMMLTSFLALGACSGCSQVDAPAAAPEAPIALEASPAAPAPVASPQLPPGAPPLAPDLLAIGSQEARDDLYCSAMIYNANPDVSDALAPVDEALLRKAQMMGFVIGESGINRLMAEKAAHATHARAIAEAYAAQVDKDVRANTPRISLDDCMARAHAVPIPQ